MSTRRILGIVLLVGGIGSLFYGLNATNSFADQVSETFTGRFTDRTTWYIIGGSMAGVAGIVLLGMGGKGR